MCLSFLLSYLNSVKIVIPIFLNFLGVFRPQVPDSIKTLSVFF